jgi:3-oxoacyl-[acyl-carrier protein] reductase
MKKRGGGAIINITSSSGHYGGASVGGNAYDASKGGLRQMTASLAAEFGPHQIRVNAIAPGVIVTEGAGGPAMAESDYAKIEVARTPLRRLGYPEDVGGVAVFLASSDSAYVNGVTVIVDGGAMAVW